MPDPQLLRSAEAPPPRTLLDILHTTVRNFPEAAALDDGKEVLTYAEMWDQIQHRAKELQAAGVTSGCRVGIRVSSGQRHLYLSILAVLMCGATYVPVDADDPDDRARLVFHEAAVEGIIDDSGFHPTSRLGSTPTGPHRLPSPSDEAWIIFTSGSTGKPKGVAVSHRSAAAFVDAEAQWFLQDSPGGPLGPDDRVLAGLSVAFDASCEEMWLAWRHGACLVPAPRSLVRSGMDLGPWLISHGITVVSTVPTLVGLWPDEALSHVRLLIVGGEACPKDLVDRLATADREVWNTYGPTETTVVACGARLLPGQPVTIGYPLAGWDLAIIDPSGRPVAPGETGELIIGGVGLGRYLDPEKDAEKYAPAPFLGWQRAYRSGDHVRLGDAGIEFVGRVDDQVKIGGRRIELGEVEAQVAALDNVRSAAVTVQQTGGGEKVLVAYVSLTEPELGFDRSAAATHLASTMPATLVPRIAVLDQLPVTTSGKVDTKALPWPLPQTTEVPHDVEFTATEQWLAELWSEVLAISLPTPHDDFFTLGGTSLAAANVVAQIRKRIPTIAVRDLYDRPRLGALAQFLDSLSAPPPPPRHVRPVPRSSRLTQSLIQLPIMTLAATPYLAWLMALLTLASYLGAPWAPRYPLWAVLFMLILFATPIGRVPLGAWGARLLTHRITPGSYPRGGSVHLRIWAAERWADASGSRTIAGATWVNYYARLLGTRVGKGVDLHSLPPVTGMLRLGRYCAIEPEVDLRGYWLDGDVLHVGPITVGANARIGTRSTLLPGAIVGPDAHLEAGSTLHGTRPMKKGSRWAGSPAAKVGRSRHRFPDHRPPRRTYWVWLYGLSSLALSCQNLIAIGAGIMLCLWLGSHSPWNLPGSAIVFAPLGGLFTFAVSMAQTWIAVRFLSLGLKPGITPVRSRGGWQLWVIGRLMDEARTTLFPLYAGQLTPWWIRSLGAKVGPNVEVSTALMIPSLTEIKAGAFLADDTLIGGYELGGGWIRAGHTRIGKRSFVGNSGITSPGRKLRKNSLVAVQSSTPLKAKAGSNWLGSPPERMRRSQVSAQSTETRTYQPGLQLKAARGAIETLRLSATMSHALCLGFVLGIYYLLLRHAGFWPALFLGGVVLMLVGAFAVGLTIIAKWVCVGRHHPGEHPLFSSFVWLNELQDAFIESVAAPWFFHHTLGTAEHNLALRLLGADIGRGAWIESYWLPETDLCHIGDGATVGPGTVVQTHLFHDRIMSLDEVVLADGATLAAHSVILPAARIGEGATIAPGSLVMRGDDVPAHTRWHGNPIEPES
ncbi:amino acid adenylation domain-containing protein [Corynebacterium sp. 3HC-13]|uniref:Pls/PosA family non-ribosomal peptide synthetase n=1 Tax=Corynebacterium poyangense TaxID=2684405 RepID=UPI001CCA7F74|nr:Pls/PosA family non-ribosomal peptide synthetase [Corynebacterium poyangense]MBZ8176486.1 amino acid adenylation domain-containing protein [Corynebacterium poyangense]